MAAIFTIPNLLGFSRLLAAPLAGYLIWHGAFLEAFWVFLIAGLTDAIDGPIARLMKADNSFGKYLDPIADKTLINTVYVTLGLVKLVPVWLVVLIFSRDFLIASTVILSRILNKDLLVKASRLSKTNTGLQIALAAIVLGIEAYGLPLLGISQILGYLIAATTFLSGALYVIRGLKTAKIKA